MSQIFNQHDRERHRFWNTAPANPLALAKATGTPYLTGKPLMPESPMPVGEHVGKTMRQVPADYLRWVNAQPWAATWRHWAPVADYLKRFPDVIGTPCVASDASTDTAQRVPTIFVDTLTPCAPSPAWRFESFCRLHVADAALEPWLHAFALGALGLEKRWYQRGGLPHYRLSEAGQERALGAGAELADRATAAQHERARQGPVFMREMPDGRRQCTKHCYADLKEAQTVINEHTQGRHRYRHNRPTFLRAYPCPHCGFYHLTSKP